MVKDHVHKLLLVEASASVDCDYNGCYNDTTLDVLTKEVDVENLLFEDWFTELLEKNGWVNKTKLDQLQNNITHGNRFYLLRHYTDESVSGEKFNINGNYIPNSYAYKEPIVVQEINPISLKEVNPALEKKFSQLINRFKKAEEAETKRKQEYEEKMQQRAIAKETKKLEKAKLLLAEKGFDIKKS